MATMKSAFQLPIGYSDHTDGIEISLAAVAMGATIIEKHLTLDRKAEGPDHAASLEPSDFKRMVAAIHRIEGAVGDGIKAPKNSGNREHPRGAKEPRRSPAARRRRNNRARRHRCQTPGLRPLATGILVAARFAGHALL